MANKNRGLGRGLDALFSQGESVLEAAETKKSEDGSYIIELPISQIDINKEQPRKSFDDESIAELAASIKTNGLLQPIAVTKENNRYTIVAGERRYRAFRQLGYETIPAIIKNLTRQQSMELALVENIQRKDLNSIEEAMAINSLLQEFGYTQQELAERLGKSRSALANSIRLLSLPESIKKMVKSGELTEGHARCLIPLPEKLQNEAAKSIVDKQLNVRQTEVLVKSLLSPAKEKPEKKVFAELNEAQDSIRRRLGTKVTIAGTPKKGKILIEYYSADELENIIDILTYNND